VQPQAKVGFPKNKIKSIKQKLPQQTPQQLMINI